MTSIETFLSSKYLITDSLMLLMATFDARYEHSPSLILPAMLLKCDKTIRILLEQDFSKSGSGVCVVGQSLTCVKQISSPDLLERSSQGYYCQNRVVVLAYFTK